MNMGGIEMKTKLSWRTTAMFAVLVCFSAGLSALGNSLFIGGDCDVEGSFAVMDGEAVVCTDGKWVPEYELDPKDGRNTIQPLQVSKLVPNIVKSDEECEITEVWDTGFVLSCNISLQQHVKQKPSTADAVFRTNQDDKYEVEVTYSQLTEDMAFEFGENSTILDVIDTSVNGYCRCFNPTSCSTNYCYHATSDIMGHNSADYYIGVNQFNASDLKEETISSATLNLTPDVMLYAGDPASLSNLFVAFCNSSACDFGHSASYSYSSCGSWESLLSYTNVDADAWSDETEYSVTITSALQDAVDALGDSDCFAVVFKYNESLLGNSNASRFYTGNAASSNRPFIEYELGASTTTTTTSTTTTSSTTTTVAATTTIAASSYWNQSGSDLYPEDLGYSVGIGTDNPQTVLHIDGGNANTGLRIQCDDGNDPYVNWNQDSTTKAAQRYLDSSDQFEFRVVDSGDTLTTRMVIDQNGRVGIGTTDPAEELEVNGNIELTNGGTISSGSGGIALDPASEEVTVDGKVTSDYSTGYGDGAFQKIKVVGDVVGMTLGNNIQQWDIIAITSTSPDYFGIRDLNNTNLMLKLEVNDDIELNAPDDIVLNAVGDVVVGNSLLTGSGMSTSAGDLILSAADDLSLNPTSEIYLERPVRSSSTNIDFDGVDVQIDSGKKLSLDGSSEDNYVDYSTNMNLVSTSDINLDPASGKVSVDGDIELASDASISTSSGDLTLVAGDGSGKVKVNGTLDLVGSCVIEGSSCDGDIAEKMHSKASKEESVGGEFESGDVVCVDLNNPKQIKFCDGGYDSNVLSVVNYGATQFIGNPNAPYPVSLKGIVPVKVDCTMPIKAGDLLVSSSKPGHAQSIKVTTPQSFDGMWAMMGSPFAKALEGCDNGEAVIKAWLT